MKTVRVLNGLRFKDTVNFKKNIIKNLPDGVEEVYLSSVGMERKGCGSYNYFLQIEINGELTELKKHTNNSEVWDLYTHMQEGSRALDNFKKQVTLMLLEDCKSEIVDLIQELD